MIILFHRACAVTHQPSYHAFEVTDLTIQHGHSLVLGPITLSIPHGKIVAIMGTSGSGKTSLLSCLSGLHSNYQGSIRVNGQELSELGDQKRLNFHLQSGYLFQNHALLLHLTILENITLAMEYHQTVSKQDAILQATCALQAVGLADYTHHYPEQLSGGMAKRAAFARAVVLNPLFLFCDEPFSGQDPINTQKLAHLIKEQNEKTHNTTFFISHEVDMTLAIADHVILLHGQKLHHNASPKALLESQDVWTKTFLHPSTERNKG